MSAAIALLLHLMLFRGWSAVSPIGTLKPAPVMEAFIVAPAVAPSPAPAAPIPVTKVVPQTEPPPVKPVVRPHRPVRTEIAPRPAKIERAVQTKKEASAEVTKPAAVANSAPSKPAANSQAATAQPVLVKKPQFLTPPSRPVYPPVAKRRGQQGTVWLEILLSETGKQIKLSIVRSSGFQSLDDAAKIAVANWKLAPYRMNGVAVSSRVQVPVEFVIQ
ncbi:MAG: TonB family protein [Pseudomonadales bacterium]